VNVYVASSWRNERQPAIVAALRSAGYEVYDFRNPQEDDRGFHWSQIDEGWRSWTVSQFCEGLLHPLADAGYDKDIAALEAADVCVLVLPAGASAHLEAGYHAGQGKPLMILATNGEPELMYKMASHICETIDQMLSALEIWAVDGTV